MKKGLTPTDKLFFEALLKINAGEKLTKEELGIMQHFLLENLKNAIKPDRKLLTGGRMILLKTHQS
jgi:hypothetical protein